MGLAHGLRQSATPLSGISADPLYWWLLSSIELVVRQGHLVWEFSNSQIPVGPRKNFKVLDKLIFLLLLYTKNWYSFPKLKWDSKFRF